MLNLTIDGRAVTVEKGKTVLDACRAAKAYVPTLCDDPVLEPYGACRLCIVKIDGLRGLPTACTTPAADGMKVTTEDSEILDVRRWTAQLLIADHPVDFRTNGQSEPCQLQEVVEHLGIREPVLQPMMREAKVDDSNACYAIDMRKCILCGLCVRACAEVAVTQARSNRSAEARSRIRSANPAANASSAAPPGHLPRANTSSPITRSQPCVPIAAPAVGLFWVPRETPSSVRAATGTPRCRTDDCA
jgi:predicted molibdopterin-dependent oxidoreductase YjgC